jgi:hypothetical protein
MSDSSWYLAGADEEALGPLSEETIIEQLKSGQLSPRQYCYREGMPDWQELSQIEPFASQMAALPKLPRLPMLPPLGVYAPRLLAASTTELTPKRLILLVAALAALVWLSQRSSPNVNLSNPKSAYRSFISAMAERDSVKALAAAYTTDNTQEEALRALGELWKAFGNFQAAIKTKFPKRAARGSETLRKSMQLESRGVNNYLRNLDSAEVKTERDTATIHIKGEKKPIRLRKMNGHWRVDMSSLGDLPDPGVVPEYRKLTQVLNRLANDIQHGKMTEDQVTQAMAQIDQAMEQSGSDNVDARYACILNLRALDGAKETWMLENRKTTNDIPTKADLVGGPYLREMPQCPKGGRYTLGRVGEYPKCSVPGHVP